MIRAIFTCFLLFISLNILSNDISLRLFCDIHSKELNISPAIGTYSIYANDVLVYKLAKNDSLKIYSTNNLISISSNVLNIGQYSKIDIKTNGDSCYLKVYNPKSKIKEKSIDGNLEISNEFGGLKIICHIDIDDYISAVAESEGGYSKSIEYYKLHAILVRTYVLGHLNRHQFEGHNVCDAVHCQVYKNKCFNKNIIKAVKSTKNKVIVDKNNNLIISAYHANSGGQTANSEDVWSSATSYLRSVKDPYAIGQRSYLWKEKISVKEWNTFLNKYYKIQTDSLKNNNHLIFSKNYRTKSFIIEEKEILFKDIRNYFRLRSAFFTFSLVDNNTLLFKGKGYGHGVGVCQQGAKKMAEIGKTHEEIIKFYYTGVKIITFY